MDAIVNAAEAVLRRAAVPALRLSELLERVRAETGTRALDLTRLRGALESRPERFRFLQPWRGPWRFVGGAAQGARGEPWVLVVTDPGTLDGQSEPPSLDRRLRRSVHRIGLRVDAESSRAVVRWHALALAGIATAGALRRRAA